MWGHNTISDASAAQGNAHIIILSCPSGRYEREFYAHLFGIALPRRFESSAHRALPLACSMLSERLAHSVDSGVG